MTQKHLNLVKLGEHDDPFWELENSVSYCAAASLFPSVHHILGFSTRRIPTGILSYKWWNNLRRKVVKLNNFQSFILVMPLRTQVVTYLTTKWNMKPQSAKFKNERVWCACTICFQTRWTGLWGTPSTGAPWLRGTRWPSPPPGLPRRYDPPSTVLGAKKSSVPLQLK